MHRKYSLILDTLTIHCMSPQPWSEQDFRDNWKQWFSGDPRKGGFGVKVEVAVSVSNHPRLLWFNVAPGGERDGRIAELPGGLFDNLDEDEMVLTDGDVTYQGSHRCHAPPHRNMRSYVLELDRLELTVQRGVERCNKWIRDWAFCASKVRMSPRKKNFWLYMKSAVAVVCKILALDQQYNEESY